MQDFVPFGSRDYFIMFAVLAFARAMDFLSTWVATPHLVLEGNPIAKWLGWKWGALVNMAIVGFLACSPLSAIIVSTASVLVAARNFQSAWLMRSMGEAAYRDWYLERLSNTRLPLYLLSLAGNTLLTAVVGATLVWSSQDGEFIQLIPYGVGMGIIAYAFAVIFFTLLSLWRSRHRRRYSEPSNCL